MPQAIAAIGYAIVNAVTWVVEGASITSIEAAGGMTIADTTILGVSTPYVVGTIAINAVSFGLQLALTSGVTPQSQKLNSRNPIAPRRSGYGTVKVGGAVFFMRTSQITGDGIFYLGVSLLQRNIEGIVTHFIYDQETRIDDESTSGADAAGGFGTVIYPGVWLDNYRVSLSFHLGLPVQVSDALLKEGFPGAWSDEHRLDGIAYVVVKAKGVGQADFPIVYKAGIPTYTAVIQAAKLWDPRLTGCDADDPTTWVYSDNAALVIMDFLWNSDGMRLPRAMIELAIDRWIAIADCCDELVPLLNGGTEKRYRLAGVYDFTEQPKNILARMLLPIDGRLHLRADGAIVLEIGEFCDPAVTITDEDIISYDMRRGPSKIDLKNEVRATYTAPGFNYEQTEADPWRNEDSILVDGLQSVPLNLDWCPSHSQARRIMKVNAIRMNPDWQGTIVTNARGALLLGLRFATFEISDLGINTTFFLQKSSIDLLNGICTFEVTSFPSNAYDFDPVTEEGVSPEHNTPGDHGIAVPQYAIQLEIIADGGGAGGWEDDGGGGARVIKTITIDPADWGTVIYYHVGRRGDGDATFAGVSRLGVPYVANHAQNGEASTVTGTLTSGAINIIAGGGVKSTTSPGAGGTGSGGDTNTSGGFDGANAASGGTSNIDNDGFPGGGGWRLTDGAHGSVVFNWRYDENIVGPGPSSGAQYSSPSANLVLSTFAPVLTSTANSFINIPQGNLVLSAVAPSVV